MTFETFVATIHPLVQDYLENEVITPASRRHMFGRLKLESVKSLKDVTRETWLTSEKVSTGGVSGGSCWDNGENGDPHRAYTNSYEEPEVPHFDEMMEAICPTITFLTYKRILKEADIQRKEETENEYYGNHTNYVYKTVQLGKLYDALVTCGVL